MRQALHIFLKDVRHLWPQIAITLVLTVAFAWIQSKPYYAEKMGAEGWAGIINMLLAMSWWYLIVSAIHQERLPGDRQFWLTRPYSRGSLVAARALLVATFINLPFFISDCAIVANQGFAPATAIGSLLWRQVVLTGVVLLPAVGVAAVTASLAHAVLCGFGIVAVFMTADFCAALLAPHLGWFGELGWVPDSIGVAILLTGALAVIAWQYKRRRTTGPAIALAAILALYIRPDVATPVSLAVAVQSHFPNPPAEVSKVQVGLAPSRNRIRIYLFPSRDRIRVDIPIEISGLPAGTEVTTDLVKWSMQPSHGRNWSSVWNSWMPVYRSGDDRWAEAWTDPHVFDEMKAQPVTLRASLVLTLFQYQTVTKVEPKGTFAAPAVGLCSIEPLLAPGPPVLVCRSAVRPQARHEFNLRWPDPNVVRMRLYKTESRSFGTAAYSPYRAVFRVTPIFSERAEFPWHTEVKWDYDTKSYHFPPGIDMSIASQRPIAHIRRELVIPNIRLADYEGNP